MADFGVMKITNKGMALYNKSLTGTQIQFTKIQSGSGVLPDGVTIEELTALISPDFDMSINSIETDEVNNIVKIKGIKENIGLIDGLISREIGLFANDPDEGEILYSYANAGDLYDFIPPETSGAYSKTFQINAAVGNASNVTAVIPTDTYVTVETFDNKIGNLSGFVNNNVTDEVNLVKTNHTNLEILSLWGGY